MSLSAFARRQLEKHGWKEGDGLGKNNDGISKPIKVALKMDKTGVGHDPGSDFTDHWWLRVFNDAANSISNSSAEQTTNVTNEKASPKQQQIPKGFVKGTVLNNGQEEKDSDCCSSEDGAENHKSSSGLPTLDDLYKFCGGATGSRAAALGIKMKGKLSRAAEQERLFNESVKGKGRSDVQNEDEDPDKFLTKKKKKKKKSHKSDREKSSNKDCTVDSMEDGHTNGNISQEVEFIDSRDEATNSEHVKASETVNVTGGGEEILSKSKKHKKKKKRKREEEPTLKDEESIPEHILEDSSSRKKKKLKASSEHDDLMEKKADKCSLTDSKEEVKKKKKRKKNKQEASPN